MVGPRTSGGTVPRTVCTSPFGSVSAMGFLLRAIGTTEASIGSLGSQGPASRATRVDLSSYFLVADTTKTGSE